MRVQAGSGVYWAFVTGAFFLHWACAGSRRLRLAAVLLANYIFCARFGLFYVLLIPACSSLDYLTGLGLMASRNFSPRCWLRWVECGCRRPDQAVSNRWPRSEERRVGKEWRSRWSP